MEGHEYAALYLREKRGFACSMTESSQTCFAVILHNTCAGTVDICMHVNVVLSHVFFHDDLRKRIRLVFLEKIRKIMKIHLQPINGLTSFCCASLPAITRKFSDLLETCVL